MARPKKTQGLGAKLAAGTKKLLGIGSTAATPKAAATKRTATKKAAATKRTATTKAAATKRTATTKAAATKRTATTKAAAIKRAKSPVAKAPARVPQRGLNAIVAPRDLNRVVSRTKSSAVSQTETGKRQDRKFIALPAGKRRASKVSIITKADGTTFKRRNPRAKAGNIYMETRANRADKFGKVARRGGQM